MARLLRAQLGDVAVLSFLEIPDGKSIEIIATVGAGAEAASFSETDQLQKDH